MQPTPVTNNLRKNDKADAESDKKCRRQQAQLRLKKEALDDILIQKDLSN